MPVRVAPISRTFDAIDGAIALIAIVLGCTGAIDAIPFLLRSVSMFSGLYYQRDLLGCLLGIVRGSLPAVTTLIAPLTIAVLIMRMRRPRLRLARCFRQYGAAACGAASIVLALEIANAFLDLPGRLDWSRLNVDFRLWEGHSSSFPARTVYGALALSLGEFPGLAVAGAYLALWATGLGRAEPRWIDRSGRALGWLWILVAVGVLVLPFTP
jgi:hypothetical protein